MSLKHRLANALDRPGGRWVLGFLATQLARRQTGRDITIFYEDCWIQRIDSNFVVLSSRFARNPRVERAYEELFEVCADHWFRAYSPKPGDVIVDVGAGDGSEVSVFSSLVGPKGRVVAIEAHPRSHRILKKQIERNRLKNVTTCQVAVMDQARTVFIEDGENPDLNAVSGNAAGSRYAVPGITLDEVCTNQCISRIDFLKMNIEGAELHAIQGMAKTIRITRSACISCHDFLAADGKGAKVRTKALVTDFFIRNGFEIVSRDQDSRSYVRDQVNAVNRA